MGSWLVCKFVKRKILGLTFVKYLLVIIIVAILASIAIPKKLIKRFVPRSPICA